MNTNMPTNSSGGPDDRTMISVHNLQPPPQPQGPTAVVAGPGMSGPNLGQQNNGQGGVPPTMFPQGNAPMMPNGPMNGGAPYMQGGPAPAAPFTQNAPLPGSEPGWGPPPGSNPGWGPPPGSEPGWGPPPGSEPGWGPPPGSEPGWGPPPGSEPGWGPPPGSEPGWDQVPPPDGMGGWDQMPPPDGMGSWNQMPPPDGMGGWDQNTSEYQPGAMSQNTTTLAAFQMPGGRTGWIASIVLISLIFLVIFAVAWQLLLPHPLDPKLTVQGTPQIAPGASIPLHGTGFSASGTVSFTVNGTQVDGTTTVKTDGTFDYTLTIPATLATADKYTIQANEQGGQGSQKTASASLALMAAAATATPTQSQATVTTFNPTSTPTPTPTPYIPPTPVYCSQVFPAALTVSLVKGTPYAPQTLNTIFCGIGSVAVAASPGLTISATSLSYATFGAHAPLVVSFAPTITSGTYSVTFTDVGGTHLPVVVPVKVTVLIPTPTPTPTMVATTAVVVPSPVGTTPVVVPSPKATTPAAVPTCTTKNGITTCH